jgi:hypothetical protein
MISSATLAQLLEEFQPGVGHGISHLAGEKAGQIRSTGRQLRGYPVKINA